MSIAPHSGHDDQAPVEHNLQGNVVDASDPALLRQAIDLAVHYRGDVTLTLRSRTTIEGYIFDCKTDQASGAVSLRMIPAGRDETVIVPLAEIEQLAFSGRDTASGKSFETWVKKYVEKKLAGQAASIEAEALE